MSCVLPLGYGAARPLGFRGALLLGYCVVPLLCYRVEPRLGFCARKDHHGAAARLDAWAHCNRMKDNRGFLPVTEDWLLAVTGDDGEANSPRLALGIGDKALAAYSVSVRP